MKEVNTRSRYQLLASVRNGISVIGESARTNRTDRKEGGGGTNRKRGILGSNVKVSPVGKGSSDFAIKNRKSLKYDDPTPFIPQDFK
jgi:hypothetical protein